MENNTTKYPRGWRRHVIGALGALVIAGSAVGMIEAAEPEHGPACNYPTGSNTCLTIAPSQGSPGFYAVRVGIDIEKSEAQAQAIINAARSANKPALTAVLVGDDGNCESNGQKFDIPLSPGWPQPLNENLSAEFFVPSVLSSLLDEDTSSDRDELCARVTLNDYRFGLHRTQKFTSGKIVGHYE